MLTENKFSTYLVYAIGEIVLVVIGILIALQINNWNELKKSLEKEALLIDQMISDTKVDSLFFQSRVSILKEQDSVVNYVLFINQFPKADTLSNILVKHQLLPNTRYALLSEVLNNNENSIVNIGSWKIKQRLQEFEKAYHFLDQSYILLNDELQDEFMPLEKNNYRLLRDLPLSSTLDSLREVYINEEVEILFSSLKYLSENSMLQLENIIPINNKLMKELKEYRLSITN